MPRKTTKTEKPPLLFRERPVCGSRLQTVPEVRAAVNPKDFFTTGHNISSRDHWVSPQFDSSAAPPVRRGRRKGHSATSSLDSCSQLFRKNTVCKFPSLSFTSRSSEQSQPPKCTRKKNATESAVVPSAGNRTQRTSQTKSAVNSPLDLDTPKRHLASIRKKKTRSDAPASSSRCLDDESSPIQVTAKCRTPDSTPGSSDVAPPDVDTPKDIHKGNSCSSSPSGHWTQAQPSTSPRLEQLGILVADTPERDYGLKVTWRRRKHVMSVLKDRGCLSNADTNIHI